MTRVALEPRLLTAAEAAGYFRMSVKRFEGLRIGRVPFGPRVLYDRVALDAYLDEASGLARPSTAHTTDDAEAALDRFTARSAHAARGS